MKEANSERAGPSSGNAAARSFSNTGAATPSTFAYKPSMSAWSSSASTLLTV